jgi:hypothetical protein
MLISGYADSRKGERSSMATRTPQRQSEHDTAVRAAQQIYAERGKHVWINPGGEKNKSWVSRYIDVIAATNPNADRAWLIEVETMDSVNDAEAKSQWKDYDAVYTTRWYLAVPWESKAAAEVLLARHGISHCAIVTWRRNPNGAHTFWGLPGLN